MRDRKASFIVPFAIAMFLDAIVSVSLRATPTLAPSNLDAGANLFQTECAVCHGRDGSGARGPDLTRGTFRHAADDATLFRVIAMGIPGSPMPGALATHAEPAVWQLVAYVRSLSRARTDDQPRAAPRAPVWSSLRVVDADGRIYTGRCLDEDTYSVRMLDGDGHLRAFERKAVRAITRIDTTVAAPDPSVSATEIDDPVADPNTRASR